MKRLLILICIFVFLLCGCHNERAEIETAKQVIVFPTEQVAETINGYKEKAESNFENSKIEYIGNKNSKKFHLSDCQYAKNMKQENVIKSFNRNEIVNSGYIPCKKCNP